MIVENFWFWAQIAALAFFSSLAITGFMSIAGLGDAPDARSAHSRTIPTSGGVGILGGLGVAFCAIGFLFPGLNLPRGFASILALLFAIGMLGLVDDALTLGAKTKFGLMLLISAAAVWLIGAPKTLPFFNWPLDLPPAVGFIGAVLWVFVVMNAVNFMDGANGMMGLSLIFANLGLLGVSLMTHSEGSLLLSGMSVMVLLGFLPYNLRNRARVFAGDVGSLSLSFLFAISVLYLIAETTEATLHLVGPVLILPFLVDVFLTLIRRALKGENLLQAHNGHLYQRLIRSGLGHLQVSFLYALAALLFANLVLVGAPQSWFFTLHVTLLMVLAMSAIYLLVSLALKDPNLANSRDDKSR